MSNILFEGIYSATYSLYDKNLKVLRGSVEKLIDYNLRNGVKGFYVGGNTGECTVLPNRVRKEMLETVRGCAGDGKIICHVGAGHYEDVLDLIDHANAVGVDAVASLPPSLTGYYRPQEIIEYYRTLASLSKAPVLAYVTSVLTCDLVWFATEIMKIENIVGLKVSIPNYFAFEQLKNINGGNLNILNGPDECMVCGLAMGADGAIGTSYNLMPKTACKIYDNFKAGNPAEALKHQHILNLVIEKLLGGGIGGWKAPLQVLGIDTGVSVAPGIAPDPAKLKEILNVVGPYILAEDTN